MPVEVSRNLDIINVRVLHDPQSGIILRTQINNDQPNVKWYENSRQALVDKTDSRLLNKVAIYAFWGVGLGTTIAGVALLIDAITHPDQAHNFEYFIASGAFGLSGLSTLLIKTANRNSEVIDTQIATIENKHVLE